MSKTILITGSSGGLGKLTAIALAKENNVIISSRNESKIKTVADELTTDYVKCDVRNSEECENAIKYIIEKYGKLDVLINNAGIWTEGNLESNSYRTIKNVYETNVLGTIYMCKAVIPHMKKQGGGRIINIGSKVAYESSKDRSIYYSSKWAIRSFSDCLRKDLSKDNIGVSCVHPDLMPTELFSSSGFPKESFSDCVDPMYVVDQIKNIVDLEDNSIVIDSVIKNIKREK